MIAPTTKGTIDACAFAVKVSGKVYYINLPQDRLRMLVHLAESLTDSGKLCLVEAPEGTTITVS